VKANHLFYLKVSCTYIEVEVVKYSSCD